MVINYRKRNQLQFNSRCEMFYGENLINVALQSSDVEAILLFKVNTLRWLAAFIGNCVFENLNNDQISSTWEFTEDFLLLLLLLREIASSHLGKEMNKEPVVM